MANKFRFLRFRFRSTDSYCGSVSAMHSETWFPNISIPSTSEKLHTTGRNNMVSMLSNNMNFCMEAGLRIRIHFIRIRVQHFRLNTDPDPGSVFDANIFWLMNQCFESELDPDSIRSVDPCPDSVSGSSRAKVTHKNRKK
jgi:hypothetical protein